MNTNNLDKKIRFTVNLEKAREEKSNVKKHRKILKNAEEHYTKLTMDMIGGKMADC